MIDRRRFVQVLVLVFVAAQVTVLPPHVVYSDPAEATLDEGHYTDAQFRASDWVGANVDTQLLVYETELWAAGGTYDVVVLNESTTCTDRMTVWRVEGAFARPDTPATVYDAGAISIHNCANRA